jgi:hypothetical protein
MYQKPAVPQSIGGVLDDTFQLYKASFASCWLPALVTALVSGAFSYFVLAVPLTHGLPQANPLLAALNRYKDLGPGYNLGNIAVWLVSLLCYGMIIANIAAVSRSETPGFASALSQSLRRLLAMIGATILFGLVVGVGLVLLLIPGIYLLVRLSLSLVPVIVESQGPASSLGTSWRLVAGNWWRVLTVITVLFVILFVLELLLGALTGVVGVLFGTTHAADAAHLLAEVSLATLAIGAVVGVFTAPLVCAMAVALYHDLLLRKGGGDLEARLGALPKA